MFPNCISRVASRGTVLALVASATVAAPALAWSPGPAPATLDSLASTVTAALSPVVDTSGCLAPTPSEPFLAWQDDNEYTLAPGESFDSFDGTGWTLGGGASIETEALADGSTGPVLDLPSGAYAVSPPMCVESDYPTARTMVQTSGGARVGAGVFYAANAANTQLQLSGVMQGTGPGFTLSQPLQVHPGNLDGWQIVQFLFGATGSGGDGQIYNFYVDPRMLR